MDDAALLERFARTGDDDAFGRLVEEYSALVLGVALPRTGCRALAEEVAQSVFAALARKANRLSRHPSLAAWLVRATVFEASRAVRRETSHRRALAAMAAEQAGASAGEAETIDESLMTALGAAMDELPSPDRDLIRRRFFEGQSYRRIASDFGKSEPACRMRARRSVDRLARILRRRLNGSVVLVAVAGGALTVGRASAASTAQSSVFFTSIQAMSVTKPVVVASAAVIAVMAAFLPSIALWNENSSLREKLASVRSANPHLGAVIEPATPRSAPAAADVSSAGAAAGADGAANPAAGWKEALFEGDPVVRATRIARLLERLDAASARAALAAFDEVRARGGGSEFDHEFRLLLRSWAKMDGPGALAAALEREPRAEGDATPSSVQATPNILAALGGWASSDPEAARAWFESLGAEAPEGLVLGLLDGWSLVDFDMAARFAESRPRSEEREAFLDLLLERSLAAGGIAAAQSWFDGIAEGEHNDVYKQRAFEKIIRSMLFRDPSAAAHWIAARQDAAYLGGDAVAAVAEAMADAGGAHAALDWLASLGGAGGDVISPSAGQLVGQWAATDPNAAGAWLGRQHAHPAYGAMAARFAESVADIDPAAAAQWSATIDDPDERRGAEVAIARRTLETSQDEVAAVEALLAAGVPPDAIESARQRNFAFHLADIDKVSDLQSGEYIASAEQFARPAAGISWSVRAYADAAEQEYSALVDLWRQQVDLTGTLPPESVARFGTTRGLPPHHPAMLPHARCADCHR